MGDEIKLENLEPTRGRCILKLETEEGIMVNASDPYTSNRMEVVKIGEKMDFDPEFSVGQKVYMNTLRGKKIVIDEEEYLITEISAIDAVINDTITE